MALIGNERYEIVGEKSVPRLVESEISKEANSIEKANSSSSFNQADIEDFLCLHQSRMELRAQGDKSLRYGMSCSAFIVGEGKIYVHHSLEDGLLVPTNVGADKLNDTTISFKKKGQNQL